MLKASNAIVAATPAEKAQLDFLYHADMNRVITIPPGVDTSHFYPIPKEEAKAFVGIPAHDRMILFVGRIEPLKGLDTLIRAIGNMFQKGVMTRCAHYLVIIGGDPEEKTSKLNSEMHRLQALCKEIGIGDLVLFLGKRSQASLPYYYSAAEVVVMPSHYESFGMVALEAMACGTPVVASQVGGLAYLIQDGKTGFFVPDGDIEALCNRLSQLICQNDLRINFGIQAAAYAKEYAWENIAARVADLYQKILLDPLAPLDTQPGAIM